MRCHLSGVFSVNVSAFSTIRIFGVTRRAIIFMLVCHLFLSVRVSTRENQTNKENK